MSNQSSAYQETSKSALASVLDARHSSNNVSHHPIPLFVLLSLAVALASFALMGCASNNAGSSSRSIDASDDTSSADYTSTAMVLGIMDGSALMVDKDTDTVYTTEATDAMVYDIDEQSINLSDLMPGNIVEVHGNGIMLETYPGQYPGITEIRVLEEGNLEDVQQYSELIEQVFAELDPIEKISGYIQYRSDLADVTVALAPYSYTIDGHENIREFEQYGKVIEDVPDVSIEGAIHATLGFYDNIQLISIKRTLMLPGSELVTIDPNQSAWESVEITDQSDDTASLEIEPGYLYMVSAQFSSGQADYLFFT